MNHAQMPIDGRPARRRPLWFCAMGIATLGLLTLAGCQSQAERRGVSSIPVNRPASWESHPGYVEGEL